MKLQAAPHSLLTGITKRDTDRYRNEELTLWGIGKTYFCSIYYYYSEYFPGISISIIIDVSNVYC